MNRRLVETDVAAAALGVTPAAVRQLAYRGRIKKYGTTRRRRYDLDELERLALRRAETRPATRPDEA